MASQDRSYYRDSQDWRPSSLSWLFGGSLQMMAAGGLRIRLHTCAILAAFAYLAVGVSSADFPVRGLVIGLVLALVLLHETAHALTARALGGYADDILIWPLGGLIDPQPPHRPLPVFLTAVAGPLMNAAICIACYTALRLMGQPGPVSLNPFAMTLPDAAWHSPAFYLHTTFILSYLMFLLNLLPTLPLDGGRVLQCALWPSTGYGRAVMATCEIGIMLSAALGVVALLGGNWLMLTLMLACLVISVQRRTVMRSAGAWTYSDVDFDVRRPRHRHHLSRLAKWRARRQIRFEEAEQVRVDEILIKVHRSGMRSLTWRERRTLRRATQRQRERAMEEPTESSR